jgi:hypothetical protein
MPFRYDSSHWRRRAAEIRALAEGTNQSAKQLMLRVAEDYEQLASRVGSPRPSPAAEQDSFKDMDGADR